MTQVQSKAQDTHVGGSLLTDAASDAIGFVIDRLEGGSKLVTDAGGTTKYGISERANPDVDVAHLTRDGAIAIYRARYWNPVGGDLLPPALALLVFDCAVNQGVDKAIRWLQTALGVTVDGKVGPKTIASASAYRPQYELRAQFNGLRLRAYEDLARKYPKHAPNLRGWRLRVLRVADEAGRWGDMA